MTEPTDDAYCYHCGKRLSDPDESHADHAEAGQQVSSRDVLTVVREQVALNDAAERRAQMRADNAYIVCEASICDGSCRCHYRETAPAREASNKPSAPSTAPLSTASNESSDDD